jgi:superfamily II helicase
MADMLLFQGAMAGLKAAADIAIGLNKLNTMTEVNAKAIELQQIILNVQSTALSAQSEQSVMAERIKELEQEVVRVKAWEGQKDRYKLLSPFDGALVYALRETMNAGEVPHWICTNCYEDGRRSVLNPRKRNEEAVSLVCPACGADISSRSYRGLPDPTYAPD